MTVFLDTNILLRHILQDNDEQSPKATEFLLSVERGETQVRLADTVIFETVFTLERTYRRSKAGIREAVTTLLQLPGVSIPSRSWLPTVFDLYVERNLPFADAYHAVLMGRLGLTEIATFDHDFDRAPGIKRMAL